MNRAKPLFNADDAEEYFSMQLEYYRTCQKEIFSRDNQNRNSANFVYSAEYQKYLGAEIALRKVLEYFAKYELSCKTEQSQNQLAESEDKNECNLCRKSGIKKVCIDTKTGETCEFYGGKANE